MKIDGWGLRGVCLSAVGVVRMNGAPWPAGGGPVSLTRLVTALRKPLVRAGCAGDS